MKIYMRDITKTYTTDYTEITIEELEELSANPVDQDGHQIITELADVDFGDLYFYRYSV